MIRIVMLLIGMTGIVLAEHSSVTPAPPLVTINELRSRPNTYSGQVVQLIGRLSECAGWECSICPETMTSKTANPKLCLPLEFRPLLKGTGFGEGAVEAVFRFASVKLNAKFDASCLQMPCLDRGTVLQEADVVDALKRRKSRLGLWLGRRTGLVPLGDAEAKIIIATAYRAGFARGLSHENKDAAMAVLLQRYDPLVKAFGVQGKNDDAVVCWIPSGLGDDAWPDSLEGAISAPSIDDNYQCNQVHRIDREWVVQVRPRELASDDR